MYDEKEVEDEFWDDTSEIINLRDLELSNYPEEDYSTHEYVEKDEMDKFIRKAEIE